MKKRVKYILSLIMTLVVTVSLCLPISAVESNMHGIDQLIKEKNESYDEYTQQIELIMVSLANEKEQHNNVNTWDLRGGPDIVTTYDLSNAYRIYKIESFFLTELNQKGSFEETLTDEIQWKVPIVTQKGESGLVTLLEDDGELSWVATEVGESSETLYVSDVKIKNAVEQAMEVKGDFNDIKIAHSYMYYTTFVYLSSDQEEYLIPFSCYSEEIGINNGELYTVAEIQKKFNNCFDEESMSENGDFNGGTPFKKPTYHFETAIVTLSFIGVVMVLIFIMKRKKKV